MAKTFIYNQVVRDTQPLKQPSANPSPATPNIVPSAGNAILKNGDFASANFRSGISGWLLDSEGNLEANNGNFRGDISGASGTFTGSITGASGVFSGSLQGGSLDIPDTITEDSAHIESDGDTYWGSAAIGTATAKILKNGQATFTDIIATGVINAEGGYLASGVYVGTTSAILCESTGLNVGVTGHIRGGQTDYFTGDGFFLGYSGGSYKLSIGKSTNYLTWDGTYLKLKGSFDVGDNGVINNSVYLVADLPVVATVVGFNSPTGID